MRILYLDCAAGIAGDMLAAALIDLLPEDDRADLRAAVDRLGLEGAGIEIRRVTRRGFAALDVVTTDQPDPPARHLPDVLGILRGAGLEPDALAVATEMFERLAAAEARVHGVEPERVHFHEVGAVDSILDVLAVS